MCDQKEWRWKSGVTWPDLTEQFSYVCHEHQEGVSHLHESQLYSRGKQTLPFISPGCFFWCKAVILNNFVSKKTLRQYLLEPEDIKVHRGCFDYNCWCENDETTSLGIKVNIHDTHFEKSHIFHRLIGRLLFKMCRAVTFSIPNLQWGWCLGAGNPRPEPAVCTGWSGRWAGQDFSSSLGLTQNPRLQLLSPALRWVLLTQ